MGSKIDAYLDEKIKSKAMPGLVMKAIDKQGNAIHERATGTIGLASDSPATLDTVFWIASCTKAVTATACMQLVEQGRLSLDDQAEKYIPELTSSVRILTGFNDAGEPQLKAPKNKITLRHLLTHTAGLGYTFMNADLKKFAENRGDDQLRFLFKKDDVTLPLTFEPGTAWQYGYNMDWVGQIVEVVSGMSLEDYFQKYIFKPCGMKDSTFLIHKRQDMLDRLAKPHRRSPEGELMSRDAPYSVSPPEMYHGGAGLFSTIQDYCKFLSIFLNDGVCPTTGERVLKLSTVDLMNESGIKEELTGDTVDSPVPTTDLETTHPLPDLFPGAKKQWGLSFLVLPEGGQSRAPGSFNWAGIMNCFWWVDRKSGIAGVTLNQVLPFGDAVIGGIFYDWETKVYELHKAGHS